MAQAGEDPGGIGGTEPWRASRQVWSGTGPGTQLPLRPGLASVEGAGTLSRGFLLVGCPPERGEQGGGHCKALCIPGSDDARKGLWRHSCVWGAVGPALQSSHDRVTLNKSPPHLEPQFYSAAAFVKWGWTQLYTVECSAWRGGCGGIFSPHMHGAG